MEVVKFLENLKVAATSPYALVAYLAVLGAWVYVATNGTRLKRITKALRHLPEKDRIIILQKEYNTTPRSGLSADQWIKSRKHTLYFLAFIAALLAVIVVILTALVRPAAENTEVRRRSDYLQSLSKLIVHSDSYFAGIKGAADPKNTNVWEATFYLAGIAAKMPEIRMESRSVSYDCDIVEDGDFAETKQLFNSLCQITTNTLLLEGWTFEQKSDLTDKEMMEWRLEGTSEDEMLELTIDLMQSGSGRENTDLWFSLDKHSDSSHSKSRVRKGAKVRSNTSLQQLTGGTGAAQ